jgi:hypothetical protein
VLQQNINNFTKTATGFAAKAKYFCSAVAMDVEAGLPAPWKLTDEQLTLMERNQERANTAEEDGYVITTAASVLEYIAKQGTRADQ